ncbi:MAG: hypothetical protein K2H47_04225 [Muribaculaceae bacterium]|nr:hypothetical protein [Muribaculaceae bacterium]
MKRGVLFSILGALAVTASAATVEFTYMPNPDIDSYMGFGFNKKDTYDCAIRLTDPTLIGSRITGMRVNIPVQNDWITVPTAWLSTELKLVNKVNSPDITSVEATVADQMLSAVFPEPYTLTEEGVYVGYSFTVVELANYSTHPLAYVEGTAPESFFVHSSRTRLKWTDEHADTGYVSTMIVTLETESGATDVAIGLPSESVIVKDEEGPVSVTLVNYGTENLNELGYSWSIGSVSDTGIFTLAQPLAPGERTVAELPVGPTSTVGTQTLTVTAETFNGAPNGDLRKTATGTMVVMPFMPVTRPLIEEYTGLGCGWCPRGYIAMEEMAEKYGADFVGLAYHSEAYETGCMVVMPDADFPVSVSGYPYGTVNRTMGMDPSEMPSVWGRAAAVVSPADIDVSIDWTDDSRTALRASAVLNFAREYSDADMSMAIAIAADGLRNDSWGQSNYYSGMEQGESDSPLWEIFLNGSRRIKDLTFNFVVVSFKDTKGVPGTVPSVITFDTAPEYDIELALNDIVNDKGEHFLSPDAELYAVGMLIDNKTGAVLNSNKSGYLPLGTSSVKAVKPSSEVISTDWTTLSGCRVAAPSSGIFIKTEYMSDGSVRHTKVVCRN